MNTPPPDDPLRRAISDALDETADLDARTRDRAARDERASRQRVLRRSLATLLPLPVVALLAAVTWWGWLRQATPTADELRQGRETVLRLAARSLEDHVRREGRLPTRFDEILPVATEVRIEATPQGVRLHMTDPDGGTHAIEVALRTGVSS